MVCKSWDEKFNILKTYYENGDYHIKKKDKIYSWVCRQRLEKKDGILSKEKEDLLLSIGFRFNESWEEMFNKFLIYFDKYKTIDISKSNEFYKEIGTWLNRQVKLIESNRLSKDKVKLYEDLGITFNKKKGLDDIWMDSYNELKNFHSINNHCDVPLTEEYKSLYRFIQTQRKNYKDGTLSEDRFELLNTLNFRFDLWVEKYNIAKDYYLKHNTLYIDDCDDEYKSLRNWIYNTRQNYNKNKLTRYQIELLKKINFPFEIIACDKEWLNNYAKAKLVFEKQGYCSINPYEHSYTLFKWAIEQCKSYKESKMSNHKINLLKKINFNFDIKLYKKVNEKWLKKYLEACRLIKKHNTYYINYFNNMDILDWIINQCKNKDTLNNEQLYLLRRIKFNFDFDKILCNDYEWIENFTKLQKSLDDDVIKTVNQSFNYSIKWIYSQYPLFINKQLSPHQRYLLRKINFKRFNRLYKLVDIKWITSYKKLHRFYRANGHYNINPFIDSQELFNWASEQIKMFNMGILSRIKIKLLKSIGFEFYIKPISTNEKRWLRYYNKLKSFRKNYGHFMVDDCGSFLKLYKWTKKQQNNYKHGILEDKYYNLLIKINFPFDSSYDTFSKLMI